ncbi:hypothetical protein [Streptomyces aidingensis]|uniref:Uncharacterized protein n=1 Tax=Streptomyces aidingensis TaxID=910347 RepID=A0A1I1RZK0_9ACTN|nr:hypothetical protein [Streptomyces aidingensis]SFD39726.1 hypothetical protein SAMN05421773_114106 [Streptomyces aidingensis]
MQPTAGPELPHTRSGPAHWLATALLLAAVTWAASLTGPAGAAAGGAAGPADRRDDGAGTGEEQPEIPVAPPDPEAAEYPLDCGPYEVAVTDRAETDLDRDGRPDTVAVVRCDAGGGTPPNGVYLLTHPAGPGGPEDGAAAGPVVAATLVDPADGMLVDRLETDGATVTVALFGYSGPNVPRAAPDLHGEATWAWRDGGLVIEQGAPPAALGDLRSA